MSLRLIQLLIICLYMKISGILRKKINGVRGVESPISCSRERRIQKK